MTLEENRDTSPAPSGGPSVEEMGQSSFPASDPPAIWTWDPKPAAKPPAERPGTDEITSR
jgi:hypothetical protein